MKYITGTTSEGIHYWTGTGGVLMVSDENTKTLKGFKALDDAVNWLYINGFKESARDLNTASRPMPPAELKTFEGWHSDEEETYVGWDTVTGDDGKEYPIKDRD